ncbi:MAG: HPF/RaiA family ribosome-associated protein [Bryobacterales bacterium]|nr:HPF/RaiA family ribosome-associated protein [Bryobacterales bacterium]
MKVSYTGRQEPFTSAETKKLNAKLAKLGKLLDSRGGEREARIVLTSERHLRRAEITVNVYDHPMAGVAAAADQFTALLLAVERLEKQVLKLRSKKRDTKREAKQGWSQPPEPQAPEPATGKPQGRQVYRVDEHDLRKPMTLEEAMLEMDRRRDYVVFRDAETDRVSVLLRRRDGHFDLVEA